MQGSEMTALMRREPQVPQIGRWRRPKLGGNARRFQEQLSVVSCQLSVRKNARKRDDSADETRAAGSSACQLPVVSSQLSVGKNGMTRTSCQLPVVSCQQEQPQILRLVAPLLAQDDNSKEYGRDLAHRGLSCRRHRNLLHDFDAEAFQAGDLAAMAVDIRRS